MSYWNDKPHRFRILFLLISTPILVFGSINIYKNIISPYDDNLFVDISYCHYITMDMPVTNIETGEQEFLQIDDIIVRVNGLRYREESLNKLLDSLQPQDTLKLEIVGNEGKTSPQSPQKIKILRKDIDENNLRFIKSCVRILKVVEGGVSDKAGLKTGDVILSLNGKEFKNSFDIMRMLLEYKRGDVVYYSVLRQNILRDIKLSLSNYGIQIEYLIFFITAIILLFLSYFLALKRPLFVQSRYLSISFLALGYIILTSLGYHLIKLDTFSNVIITIQAIAFTFGIPIFSISFFYFPEEVTFFTRRKWVKIVPIILGVLAFIFVMRNLIILINPVIVNITYGVLTLIIVLYTFILRFLYRKHINKRMKKISFPIRLSMFLIIANSIVSQILINNGLYKVAIYSSGIMILLPLSYIYVIGRYKLLDLNIKIRRNIKYIIVANIFNVLFVVAFLFLIWKFNLIDITIPNLHFTGTTIEILDNPLSPDKQMFYQKLITVYFALVLLYGFWKFRKYTLNFFENVFYVAKFDYKKAIKEISEIMSKSLKLDDLTSLITMKVREIVNIKDLGIIVFDEEHRLIKQDYSGFESNSFKEFVIENHHSIYENIIKFENGAKTDYLPHDLKTVLHTWGFQYLVPLFANGRTYGVLLIGEKLSESSLQIEDLEFLTSIGYQSAVAIENAILYENLAKQERIKLELELARRIQLGSLPMKVPDLENLEISGISEPAFEVGGDFFDYFLDKDKKTISIFIGDVSGKGTSAALYMSKAQGIIRTLNEFDLTPAEIFNKANSLLYKTIEKSSFISVLGIKLDLSTNKVVVSRAGHLPLIIFRNKTKEFSLVKPKGIVLGISNNEVFSKNVEGIEISFEEGDIFVMLTDGITEAINSNDEELGITSILDVISRYYKADAEFIKDKIMNLANEHSKNQNQTDDRTCVVIKSTNINDK